MGDRSKLKDYSDRAYVRYGSIYRTMKLLIFLKEIGVLDQGKFEDYYKAVVMYQIMSTSLELHD